MSFFIIDIGYELTALIVAVLPARVLTYNDNSYLRRDFDDDDYYNPCNDACDLYYC